jgi:dTDP-4-dehydrorhamnose reductase
VSTIFTSIYKVERINPDIIVHCAALTDVDYCQDHPREAYDNNVTASVNIAEAAKNINSHLIFISTESVFDGNKGNYAEEDRPNPVHIYGKSKLEAERRVFAIVPDACVMRTTFYGWNKLKKLSLAEWVIKKASDGEEVGGFKDIYFSPILVNTLARFIFRIDEMRYAGTIHVAGGDSCSKFDFASMMADIFGLNKNLIKPISCEEMGLKAPRAKKSTLNVLKAVKLFGETMPGIKEGILEMKNLYENGYVDSLKDN